MLVHRRRLSLRVSGCLTMFFCKEQHRSSRCRRQSSSPRRYGDTVSKCCYDLSISSRYADAEVGAFVFRPLDFAKLDSVVPVVCLFVLMIFSHVVILKTHRRRVFRRTLASDVGPRDPIVDLGRCLVLTSSSQCFRML